MRQESLGAIEVTNVRPTGVPGTGLGAGIVNGAAVDPVLGANRERFDDKMAKVFSDDARAPRQP